jgi:hypothetical protein
LATTTGAAQKAFWVNTPATVEPGCSSITTKSLRPGVLIPALVVPSLNPATRCIGGKGLLPVAIFISNLYLF